MFTLAPLPTFERTVSVRAPSATRTDAFDTQTLKITFRAIDAEEASRLDQQWLQLPPDERLKNQHYLLKAVVLSWSDVADAGGNEVAFSASAFDQALAIPWFAPAAIEAYRKGLAGEEARLGN